MEWNENLFDPVDLDLSLSVDQVSRGRLVATARKHDIVVGTFTDEELILCGDDPDSTGDPHWTPYVDRLSDAEVDIASRACIRQLLARGLLSFDEAGSPTFEQPHATLEWPIQQASALVTWRSNMRNASITVAGVGGVAGGDARPSARSTGTFDPEVAATAEELIASWRGEPVPAR